MNANQTRISIEYNHCVSIYINLGIIYYQVPTASILGRHMYTYNF